MLTLCCWFFWILVPAAQAAAPSATDAAEPDFAAIDSYVAGQVRDLRIPGLALGIVRDDQIVHLQSFGTARPEGTPVTPQTGFVLGSSTKSFTALAIMQLVEAGKVELDTPVQRYLPWFRVADPDASARITVRHLLNHTSGLPNSAGTDDFTARDTSAGALETTVRRLSTVQLVHAVGTTFEYSNPNYLTLGLIVQVVSGRPYETYIQEHIFAPLNMTHSYTSPAAAQQHGLATGYRYWFQFPLPAANLEDNRGYLPAGFLISSAEDMSHYLIAQLNDGVYAGRRVLSADGMTQLHFPAAALGNGGYYAMGWMVGSPNGVPVITHSGGTAQYRSDMIVIPRGQWGRWGVVVLTNANTLLAPAGLAQANIVWGVTDRITGEVLPLPELPPAEQYWQPIQVGAGLLLLMLIRLIWAAWNIWRWRRHPPARPARGGTLAWRVGFPLLCDAAVVAFFLAGLPRLILVLPRLVELYQPDLFWVLGLSFLVVLVWGPIRAVLTVLALRPRQPAVPARQPAPVPAQ
jgi:CubicO group peptidase (beta-lactamase class C family)